TLIRIADPFFISALRLIAFDSYQRLDPAPYNPDLPVRIVALDDDSLAKIGQWPWPRTVIADLVNRLGGAGAAAGGFDVSFGQPDQTSPEQLLPLLPEDQRAALAPLVAGEPSHDQILAAAMKQVPVVLAIRAASDATPPPTVKGGFAIAGDDPKPFIPDF